MIYLDVLPIASLCMPALLAVYQETYRGNDTSALNFTVHGSPSHSGTSVVTFGQLILIIDDAFLSSLTILSYDH